MGGKLENWGPGARAKVGEEHARVQLYKPKMRLGQNHRQKEGEKPRRVRAGTTPLLERSPRRSSRSHSLPY